MNLGLNSQPKLNRHSDERVVKNSDQNTKEVRRRKSQTESEQNWFSKIKTSWIFFPYRLFVILLWTYLLTWVQTTYGSTCVNFFSAKRYQNKHCRKYNEISQLWLRIALVCTKFPKNSPEIVFSWNSTYESPLNLGQNATNFRSNGWVFVQEKNQTVSHTNEPSFQLWQWSIKNLLPILWDESGPQISAKTQ